MIILGVDPGSRRTGYAVLCKEGSQLSPVTYGTIALGKSGLESRLLVLYQQLSAVVDEHRPQYMAVEGIFHAKHAGSALKLGHARGVILLVAALNNLELHEFAPRAVKQAVTSSGKASKEQVQRMVKTLLRLSEDPQEDAADALAVAMCCSFQLRPGRVGATQ